MLHNPDAKYAKPEPRVRVKRMTQALEARQALAFRKAVRQRDGGRCRVCQKKYGQHVHHINYLSRGGARHDTKNGVLLCAAHHADCHAGLLRFKGNADDELWAETPEATWKI
jgi:hypothetical protein